MSIRAVHVVPAIANEASGPSYSVVKLCQALQAFNCDTTLAVLDSGLQAALPEFVRTFPMERFPRSLGRSSAMQQWLQQGVIAGDIDIMHNHSLWMMPNVYAGKAVLGTTVPLVVSPRGTLSSWALNRSKWLKKLYWLTLQSEAIKKAACFHATSELEYHDIRRAGFKQAVSIIPNGIDIPNIKTMSSNNNERKRLLFLGRIHPVKGLENLLQAWAVVSRKFPDWQLDIVGPDTDKYSKEMQLLAQKLMARNTAEDRQRINFKGPLYGTAKTLEFAQANLYVLPSYSENFGMTVVEALAAGTPVITTSGTPWATLEDKGAGWWIDIGPEPLIACLDKALSCSAEQLARMGANGREWMEQDYGWDRVGQMMSDTYTWLLSGTKQTDLEWIRTD